MAKAFVRWKLKRWAEAQVQVWRAKLAEREKERLGEKGDASGKMRFVIPNTERRNLVTGFALPQVGDKMRIDSSTSRSE